MEVYRLAQKSFGTKLSGQGARMFGGRWNSQGNDVIYCSHSRSLAFFEIIVNGPTMDVVLKNYLCFVIAIPQSIGIIQIEPGQLSRGWDHQHITSQTVDLGDAWYQDAVSAILQVPSAAVTGEYNYLLNPNHRDFSRIKYKTEVFPFDPRLLR